MSAAAYWQWHVVHPRELLLNLARRLRPCAAPRSATSASLRSAALHAAAGAHAGLHLCAALPPAAAPRPWTAAIGDETGKKRPLLGSEMVAGSGASPRLGLSIGKAVAGRIGRTEAAGAGWGVAAAALSAGMEEIEGIGSEQKGPLKGNCRWKARRNVSFVSPDRRHPGGPCSHGEHHRPPCLMLLVERFAPGLARQPRQLHHGLVDGHLAELKRQVRSRAGKAQERFRVARGRGVARACIAAQKRLQANAWCSPGCGM